jgi:hypothetical protein
VSNRLVQLQPSATSSDRDLKIKSRHSQQFYSYADKLLEDELHLARLAGTRTVDFKLAATLRHSFQPSRAGCARPFRRWKHDRHLRSSESDNPSLFFSQPVFRIGLPKTFSSEPRLETLPVVSHCSNPDCLKPLHYLREGRIYVFDLPDPNILIVNDGDSVRRLEHFWLCGPCSKMFTLEHVHGKGIRVVHRRKSMTIGIGQ